MKLYHSPASPYVRKVMITLHETRQLPLVELIPAGGHPVDPGTMPLSLNPLGKIPALERETGPALYDSRVICRYFNDTGRGTLYPAGETLWDSLTLEATGDGIADAAILMIYESRTRPEEKRHDPWVEGQWAKIARALDALESRWMAHLHGPFDIGQVAVVAALGYLDLRHAARDWRAGRPSLAAWAGKMAERPSVKATMPEG
ncbi:glutathione S-transferase [Frigidibacter sp. ROC022]|uniref:glutathione S-transferase n=1 Tax=Frigidibacter sp. ROC022 TaxID=2971796 RepID=UPI00215B13F2|nr:glutathione S-transferase [Frigidibacter sp. ROC022]MCR8724729.1 glutathione S-transferase [Frigidibacter sp. ROC022]